MRLCKIVLLQCTRWAEIRSTHPRFHFGTLGMGGEKDQQNNEKAAISAIGQRAYVVGICGLFLSEMCVGGDLCMLFWEC